MIDRRRIAGPTAAAGGVIALLVGALVALMLAGAGDERDRAFSLQVPSALPVVGIAPGAHVCQGPVATPAALAAVSLFVAAPGTAGSRLVLQAGSRPGDLATPHAADPGSSPTQPRFRLGRTLPAGSTLTLCLRNLGTGRPLLLGAAPSAGSGTLSVNGRPLGAAAAVEGLAPHRRSLLSSLPTAFARASLFRPSWVAPWTYWLLLALLVAGAFVAIGGLLAAATEDAATDEQRTGP